MLTKLVYISSMQYTAEELFTSERKHNNEYEIFGKTLVCSLDRHLFKDSIGPTFEMNFAAIQSTFYPYVIFLRFLCSC